MDSDALLPGAYALIMAAVVGVSAWQLWRAYSRGVVSMRGGSYSRAEAPIRFWIAVVMNGIAMMVFLVAGGLYLDRTYFHPGLDHYAHLYPRQAQRQSVEGQAKLRCTVAPGYRLKDCIVGWEDRPGYGFGAAALGVAAHYTLPEKDHAKVRIGQSIVFPVAFRMPTTPSRPATPADAAPRPTPPAPGSS